MSRIYFYPNYIHSRITMHHLKVKINSISVGDSTLIEIDLIIDGTPLFIEGSNPVVDVHDLVIYGAIYNTSTKFDLCTCTCGVAGCAGFHEEVMMTSDDKVVEWRIPLCGYNVYIDPIFVCAGAITLTFDRHQYEQEWASVISQLTEIERQAPMTLGAYMSPLDLPLVDYALQLKTSYVRDCYQQAMFTDIFCQRSADVITIRHDTNDSYTFDIADLQWVAEGGDEFPTLDDWKRHLHDVAEDWSTIKLLLDDGNLSKAFSLIIELYECYHFVYNGPDNENFCHYVARVGWDSLTFE